MFNIKKSVLSLLFLSTMILPQAEAALSLVGPNDPAHGFPKWYKDSTGLRLTLCLDRAANCAIDPAEVNINRPIVFPTNFPPEAFYWSADARVRFGNPRQEVRLVLALEAAFASEIPRAGDRLVFGRVRIRGRGLTGGTYRIIHPFGSQIFEVDGSDEGRQISESSDIGIAPEIFTGAIQSGIGPFLVWDRTVPPLAPRGFVGDPEVPHRVTGSPFGTNFLRVQRRVNGVFVTVAEEDEFNVLGKIAPEPEEPVVSASPRSGIFQTLPTVTLTSSIPSTIFYTLNGTNPLTSPTRIRYTGPIVLQDCAALRFGAVNGTARSDLSQELYVEAQ